MTSNFQQLFASLSYPEAQLDYLAAFSGETQPVSPWFHLHCLHRPHQDQEQGLPPYAPYSQYCQHCHYSSKPCGFTSHWSIFCKTTDRIWSYSFKNRPHTFEWESMYSRFASHLSNSSEMGGVGTKARLVFFDCQCHVHLLANGYYFDFWRKKGHNFAF